VVIKFHFYHARKPQHPASRNGLDELWTKTTNLRLQTPAGMLDVIDMTSPIVALVEKMHGRYICLSHCWGRQSHFRLTRETLSQMRAGLEIWRLAKNFQDAIQITRLLGIRYLWIDALCILQDSHLDWELESAKMGQYYKNSWLTISAGMSDGAADGLLAKHSTHGRPIFG